MSNFNFLIFLFLELLAIEDTAERPREGIRRGELWSSIAFNLSKSPIELLNELERMSRGMTIIIIKMTVKNIKNLEFLKKMTFILL